MASIIKKLSKLGLAHPPKFLPDNIHYETMMGSVAYGVSSDTSDVDVYGFCIPPKDDVFPHLRGEILGFGRQKHRFEQYQEHHVKHTNGTEYDLNNYSIVKYFQLVMENNPNMVDSLYTPVNCILHITGIGQMVRDHRDMFLHKGAYHKFRGYAFSQIAKIRNRERREGKRKELIEEFGYDVKFAYHTVRLLDEAEQILETGTLDLQRSRKVLKAVRSGAWTQEQVLEYFDKKERYLEELYHSSSLPHSPDEDAIKSLLLNCLEAHYGSLDNVFVEPGLERRALQEILDTASRALRLSK